MKLVVVDADEPSVLTDVEPVVEPVTSPFSSYLIVSVCEVAEPSSFCTSVAVLVDDVPSVLSIDVDVSVVIEPFSSGADTVTYDSIELATSPFSS